MFTQAETFFTQAMTVGTTAGATAIVNAAQVGRARARLNLGHLPDAKADAQAVPAGFVYNVPYNAATSYSQNLLFRRQKDFLLYGIAPPFRNLTFGGVIDPRTIVDSLGLRGADGVSQVWAARKYPAQTTAIPLAKYQEAQLIIAEIDGGQTAVDIINALHTAAGLPPFASSDPTAILDQVIQERDRELFLEGQRFYTIRRFNLPLNPVEGTIYPIKGGTYGDQRCFPMPDIERTTNPKLRGG
jgi:starch-binding outer membrane protein, SusD/RagB family